MLDQADLQHSSVRVAAPVACAEAAATPLDDEADIEHEIKQVTAGMDSADDAIRELWMRIDTETATDKRSALMEQMAAVKQKRLATETQRAVLVGLLLLSAVGKENDALLPAWHAGALQPLR